MATTHLTSKKDALLQAAKMLFGEYGYTETTFKKISESAGVALGLLTHHYGNKEKLFLACGLEVLGRFLSRLQDAMARAQNGHEAVLNFCTAYLDFSINPENNWLVLVRCSPYSDMKTSSDREIMNSKFKEIHFELCKALKRGVRDGTITPLDEETTTQVIISLMVGVNRTRVLTPYASTNLYEEALLFVDRAITPNNFTKLSVQATKL